VTPIASPTNMFARMLNALEEEDVFQERRFMVLKRFIPTIDQLVDTLPDNTLVPTADSVVTVVDEETGEDREVVTSMQDRLDQRRQFSLLDRIWMVVVHATKYASTAAQQQALQQVVRQWITAEDVWRLLFQLDTVDSSLVQTLESQVQPVDSSAPASKQVHDTANLQNWMVLLKQYEVFIRTGDTTYFAFDAPVARGERLLETLPDSLMPCIEKRIHDICVHHYGSNVSTIWVDLVGLLCLAGPDAVQLLPSKQTPLNVLVPLLPRNAFDLSSIPSMDGYLQMFTVEGANWLFGAVNRQAPLHDTLKLADEFVVRQSPAKKARKSMFAGLLE
jgi:hypothetical protein